LALGADLAVNYKTSDFVTEVRKATSDRGVDVILDMVGDDYIPRDVQTLAPDGRITCIATPGGSATTLDIRALMAKRGAVMASHLRARTPQQKREIARKLLEDVWPLLPRRDPIRPVVDSVFKLEDAAAAHRRLESSQHVGKIVLSV
jgi:NADPH2:quinone reductase